MNKRIAFFVVVLLGVLGGLAVMDHALPPNLSRLDTAATTVLDRQGRLLAVRPAPGGVWRLRTVVSDVDPAFLARLIAVEDGSFWHHPGVNPLSLLRAAVQDLRAGHIVSGGSTLTMQVARLLTPRPRTVSAKLIEIVRAFQLERRFSKRDILGMWLTLAPYGGNLEGVRAGSLAWFGIEPHQLDDAQAALLVAIPRRPEALRPDRHPARARLVRDRVLHADGGDMPGARHTFPHHAALALPDLPDGSRTTIDLNLQVALEAIVADRAMTLPDHAAMALLVADAATGEIRALASGNTTDRISLDLTNAIRSPGSALKPFIYAMAFEAGQAGPDTVLDDLPRRFGGYAPENFDRSFSGRVTMAEALRRSLNMPAVALLQGVGPSQFLARMNATGVTLHLPRTATGVAEPALPLALGGVGSSLRDMASLYTAIAGNGAVSRLRLTCCELPPKHLLSARAAATIAGVLTQSFPDGGPDGVAWKTGTSWGGRDAWAMGFDARHVAGAWVGRPDGTPLPGATGRALALPLVARLFNLLPPSPRQKPPLEAEEQRPRVTLARADLLKLLFPPQGSVLSGDGPVTLRAMGGQRPLVFLVDGVRLATDPARREAAWQPPGAGFYQLTILDADGQSTRSAVRVR